MPRSEQRVRRIRSVLASRQVDLTVVMENIYDPHNVSAIMRTCDAVGVLRAELLYYSEAFPRIGRKSSSSAGKWVERRKHHSVPKCYDTLRSEGSTIYAAVLTDSSQSLFELDLTAPVALVFGNEHRGVSDEAARLSDGTFKIPMLGMIESLNVSVACAVTLYEALRQRLGRPEISHGMDVMVMEEMVEEWLKR